MAREVIDIIIQERGATRVAGKIGTIGTASTVSASGVQLLRNALRGLGAAFAVREVLRAVDSYQRMQNQLRVVGYETDQLAQAQDRLFTIAQKTRTPLEDIVNLYGKLAQSAGELGKSEQEMMRFVELTGTALAIQGTSTQGSRAALLQLSQAMGEGIVRAQEYNSLIENARPLLIAAAAGMDGAGGSVAKLRTMVLAGTVTSTAFFEAVLKGGEILDEQFGRTIPTIGQGLTKLRNAFTKFMGESSAGQLILRSVSGTLIALADNFVMVASLATIAGIAFAAYWGSAVLGRSIKSIWGAVKAQQALNIALGATGRSAGIAAAGLKFVVAGIRGITLAMATNPLGLFLVAAVTLVAYMYSLRDVMVTVGQATATLGSIVSVVWDNVLGYVQTFIDNTKTWFSDWYTKVKDWFLGIGTVAKVMGNFLVAVIKSTIDIWVGQFRLLYDVAIGVFTGIAKSGSDIFTGIAAAITLDFDAAGQAFSDAFSADNFNFDAVVAGVASTAATVGANFGRDFLGEAGGVIENGKASLTSSVTQLFEGVTTEAAARDALKNVEVPEFEFITPPGAGGTADKKQKLNDLQARLKELLQDTAEAANKAAIEQQVLNYAYDNGFISTQRYALGLQDVRLYEAQAALEGTNLAAAIRETDQAIIQLKIDSGGGSFADGFLLGLSRMSDGAVNFAANTGALFADFWGDFADGAANSIGRAIVYSEDLGEALYNVGREALASLISGLVKMGIQWLLNATIGQAVATSATAASVAQAAIVSTAWATPAALASLATSGANAIPAAAGVASVVATTNALAAFATGGRVSGPGGPTDDSILARLSDGEFVVNAKDTKENIGLLEMINAGTNLAKLFPAYATGGRASSDVRPASKHRMPTIAAADAKSVERSDRQNAQAAPVVVKPEFNNINVLDPSLIGRYMQSPDGRQAVINIMTEEGLI